MTTIEKKIIDLRSQGYSITGVARQLNCTESEVHRAIAMRVIALRKKRQEPLPIVQPRKQTKKEKSFRTGEYVRCQDCKGMVLMPCRLCAIRKAKS